MPALPRERLAMASASDAAALGRTCIPAGTADTATNAAAVTNPSKIYCDPCKKWLPSYEIWRKHIHSSRNHFACPICDIDHRTLEARKRHLDQVRTKFSIASTYFSTPIAHYMGEVELLTAPRPFSPFTFALPTTESNPQRLP